MPARTTRQQARERLIDSFITSLDRVIPPDEAVPLKGRTFLDWEKQWQQMKRTLISTQLEERAALEGTPQPVRGRPNIFSTRLSIFACGFRQTGTSERKDRHMETATPPALRDVPVTPAHDETHVARPASRKALWAGRMISALPVLALLISAAMKFAKPAAVVEGFTKLGWPERLATPLGVLELVVTVLYVIPRTAVLGAILVTGYFGGAAATHVRVGDPFIVPVLLGVLAWLGLYLRDPRLRALLPLRR